jgi:tetratricopeptide (TPR) repeat protein
MTIFRRSPSALLALFAISIISGCVSSNKFQAQSNELEATKKLLGTTIANQEALQKQLSAAQDSIALVAENLRADAVKTEYSIYKKTIAASDYQNASVSLLRLMELDPTQSYWVYDSLAYYHYLYLNNPTTGYVSPSALYYAEQGLKLNPGNEMLLEIKGKLLVLFQNDTAAYNIFQNLWKKTGDYTYLWNMTYIDFTVYRNVKKVENTVAEVLKNPTLGMKTVRVTQLEERRIETIPAKAAFLFLRGVLQTNMGQFPKAIKTMEEVLKIAPSYSTAARYLQELKSPQYR